MTHHSDVMQRSLAGATPTANSTGTGRRIAGRSARRRKRLIAFGWYGGEFSHLDFILPHLPSDATHFCGVFGGSAAVLINRESAKVETSNDLDSEPGGADPDVGLLVDRDLVSVRFALIMRLLGKLPDPSWDSLCLQRGDPDDADAKGRSDARSFCSKIVVPWKPGRMQTFWLEAPTAT